MAEFFIWEGVYPHYDDAPKKGGGFDTDFWRNRNKGRVVAELETLRVHGQVPDCAKFREYVLPVVVAMAAEGRERLSILDFGGGMGNGFVPLLADLPALECIDYVIVDNDRLCDAARPLFEGSVAPTFRSTLPGPETRFDLVHAGSVLPYIRDWKELLARLLTHQPRHLLLSDLLAGSFPTFATVQNSFGDTIPHWFFNLDEVIETVEGLGMRLLFKAPYVGRFLGQEGPLPMDNFPPQYRLRHASHLLFGRP